MPFFFTVCRFHFEAEICLILPILLTKYLIYLHWVTEIGLHALQTHTMCKCKDFCDCLTI